MVHTQTTQPATKHSFSDNYVCCSLKENSQFESCMAYVTSCAPSCAASAKYTSRSWTSSCTFRRRCNYFQELLHQRRHSSAGKMARSERGAGVSLAHHQINPVLIRGRVFGACPNFFASLRGRAFEKNALRTMAELTGPGEIRKSSVVSGPRWWSALLMFLF